ncbi:secreted Ly-6/uPAR domain-containing protein 2 [Tupaia chinensis]|uniref:Secreted Ly-6/uPAR domain-containing protein 2 n=1 Tax=Tupaia chinensis TaxID=246437 RepID=L9KKZ9_TUPCH|nr:secreted Ly-6/uPAR domain-containing protein 2 [Tupaia chinensis]ELW63431.1 Secreted Ly-6/uPAR-related protein 2 [Tupaia chinensis]
MRLLAGLLLAAALSLKIAASQAMWCHQCKGFGGCSQEASCPQDTTHCIAIATPAPINFPGVPVVTKMCYRGCPDSHSLGLGPYVSIICCQASLCNHD